MNKKEVTDHIGNKYGSLKAMCENYPVKDADTYALRLKRGMSQSEALLTPLCYNRVKYVDHLGVEYPSRAAICKKWGITPSIFIARQRLGWDMQKILTTQVHETEWLPVKDVDGNEYRNVAEMCKALNISRSAYDRRKNNKNQLEDTIKMRTKHSCTDGAGGEFQSISAMCKHYNISRDLFYYRTKDLNMPVYEALTAPVTEPPKRVADRIGEKHIANNGCEYIIIDAKNDTDVTVKFIDGAVTKTSYSTSIKNGIVKHPTLKLRGKGTFVNFQTSFISKFGDKTYYKCKCTNCQKEDILTPMEMFMHSRECHINNNQV